MHGTTVKTIEINFSLQSSTDIIFTKWLLLQYRQYGVIASAVSYNFRHAEFEAEIVCNSIHVGQRNVWVWAWNLIIAWTAQRDRQQSSLCFLREILLTSGNSAKLCTSRGRQQQLNTGEVKLGRIIGDLYGNFFSHGGHMLKVSTPYDDLFASIFTLWAGQLSRYSDWLRAGRSGDRIPVGGSEIFRTCPDRPWGPPSLLYNGYPVFPGGKERLGHDADSSPPSSAMVMKE